MKNSTNNKNDKIAWHKLLGPLHKAYCGFRTAYQNWSHPSAEGRLYSLQCLFEDLDLHEQDETLARKKCDIQSAFLELAQTDPKQALDAIIGIAEQLYNLDSKGQFWVAHIADVNETLGKLSPEEDITIFHTIYHHLPATQRRDFLIIHAEKIGPHLGKMDKKTGSGFHLDDIRNVLTTRQLCDMVTAYAPHLERHLSECPPDSIVAVDFISSSIDSFKAQKLPVPAFLEDARKAAMNHLLPAAFKAASLPGDERFNPLAITLTNILKLGVTPNDDIYVARAPHIALMHFNQSGNPLFVLCYVPDGGQCISPLFAAARSDKITSALETSVDPGVSLTDFMRMSMDISLQIHASQYPHLVSQQPV